LAWPDLRRSASALAEPPSRVAPPSARALLALLALPFTWVFLANSWTGDDAFISYRAGWNLLNGYGFTFNPGERVLAFTNALWTALLSAVAAVSGEFFYSAQVVSWLCGIGVIRLVVRHFRVWTAAVAVVLVLLSSKAYVDYSSSGLETPLNYLLLAAVALRTLRVDEESHGASSRSLLTSTLLAALAFVNRPDTVLLSVPLVAWQAVRTWRRDGWRALRTLALGSAPAALWLIFSVVYYGFPFPNTYYAKVATGLPAWMVIGQGITYVVNSLSYDPLTLLAIGAAAIAACVSRRPAAVVASGSALLHVAYVVGIGGDFMSGRFFALPFLQSALVLGSLAPRSMPLTPLVAGLAAYTLLNPLSPVRTDYDYGLAWPWRQQNGIKDERGAYHAATNLLRYDPLRPLPDFVWVREGLSARRTGVRVLEHGSIGMVGYYGGPELYVIDRNALADPFLARLPVSDRIHFEFYAGHFFRDVPDGYLASRRDGANRLADPLHRELYNALVTVCQGPIWSGDRARAIWRLNFGDLSDLHEAVRARRPVDLSERAGHWRFSTDVGDRDGEQRWLRSTGRAGYLQLGPGIPLKAGAYVARWLGTVESTPGGELGTVEAWADDRLVGTLRVHGGPGPLEATLPFVVPRATGRVDYRFLVRDGVQVTLERIELRSQ
jgi:arabinofuranosyltransferase